LHHIQPDHLGTPRKVIQTSNNTAIWNWPILNNAFGEAAPTGAITLNLRFPGQYFDAETGLNYNYFRDYEPGTGRYVESDPIGLDGGLSTYSYVGSKPLLAIDPLGLKSRVCCKGVTGAGLFGFKHCYVEVQPGSSTQCCGNDGKPRKTYGLFGDTRGPRSTYGLISENHGFDNGGDCGPWVDTCESDQCVEKAAQQYTNPSVYRMVRGPNSNTFAGTIARTCGLTKNGVGGSMPGWDDSPAGPK